MKKLKKLSFLLVMFLVLSTSTTVVQAAMADSQSNRIVYFDNEQTYSTNDDTTDIAMYQDWRFTWRSAPENVVLQADCDTISLHATCEGDVVDTLVCHIIDVTHEGQHDADLPFTANGSVTTLDWAFPAGRYKIYFTGDTNIQKTYALAVFTRFNTGLYSLQNSTSPSQKRMAKALEERVLEMANQHRILK